MKYVQCLLRKKCRRLFRLPNIIKLLVARFDSQLVAFVNKKIHQEDSLKRYNCGSYGVDTVNNW